jgi:N-acetylmuramoyl-L-alanine amidase
MPAAPGGAERSGPPFRFAASFKLVWSGMSFLPDSFMVADVIASPNHGERARGRAPDMIVLHYTGMPDAKDALARLCSPDSKVSAHYFVFEDGRVVQMVPETRRAWHAGESVWLGETDINSCSIGIEIAHPGHDPDYPDFPQAQVAAVASLCRGIIVRRDIPARRVLAHSDVAPGRKRDPGEKFPWAFLHRMGVGHWVPPLPIVEGPDLVKGDRGPVVGTLKSLFAEYGYGVTENDEFDGGMHDVVVAFQRHFRQERVDGVVDSSTLMTLRRLLDALPESMVVQDRPESPVDLTAEQSDPIA